MENKILLEAIQKIISENIHLLEADDVQTPDAPQQPPEELSKDMLEAIKDIKGLDNSSEKIETVVNAYEKFKNEGNVEMAQRMADMLAQIFDLSHKYIQSLMKFYTHTKTAAGSILDPNGQYGHIFDAAREYLDKQIFTGQKAKGEKKGENRWTANIDAYLAKRKAANETCCFVPYFKRILFQRILNFFDPRGQYAKLFKGRKSLSSPASSGKDDKRTFADTMGAEDKDYEDIEKDKKKLQLEIRLNKVADGFYEILKEKFPLEWAAIWDLKVIRKLKIGKVVDDIVDNGTNYGDINDVLKPILETNTLPDPKDAIIKKQREKLQTIGADENTMKKSLCKFYLNEMNKSFKRELLYKPRLLKSTLKNLFISNDIQMQDKSLSKDAQEAKFDEIIFDYVNSALGKRDGSGQERLEKEKITKQVRKDMEAQEKDAEELKKEPQQTKMSSDDIEKYLASQGLGDPDAVRVKKSYDDEESLYESADGQDVEFIYHQYNPNEFISKLMSIEARNKQLREIRLEIRNIINKNCKIF